MRERHCSDESDRLIIDECQVRAPEFSPVSLKQKVAVERRWELNHLLPHAALATLFLHSQADSVI